MKTVALTFANILDAEFLFDEEFRPTKKDRDAVITADTEVTFICKKCKRREVGTVAEVRSMGWYLKVGNKLCASCW